MTINFEYISTNGIKLHTAFAGKDDGVPIILLHGFPEAWFGWQAQIEPLVEAGFRVIVPDQRGYNLSDKPEGVSSYRMNLLVEDIIGLADALGYNRFFLAGHDFGAMVAWNLALAFPDRVERLAIANVPHPDVMRNYLRSHLSQMLKSWYAIFFQLPGLPERMLKAGNWKFLISAMPDYFTEETRNRYRKAWAQPAAITAMINWYRATLNHLQVPTLDARIKLPTLIVWGRNDPHLSFEMAALSAERCDDCQLIIFDDATHWVQHDKADQVSDLLVDFFSPA